MALTPGHVHLGPAAPAGAVLGSGDAGRAGPGRSWRASPAGGLASRCCRGQRWVGHPEVRRRRASSARVQPHCIRQMRPGRLGVRRGGHRDHPTSSAAASPGLGWTGARGRLELEPELGWGVMPPLFRPCLARTPAVPAPCLRLRSASAPSVPCSLPSSLISPLRRPHSRSPRRLCSLHPRIAPSVASRARKGLRGGGARRGGAEAGRPGKEGRAGLGARRAHGTRLGGGGAARGLHPYPARSPRGVEARSPSGREEVLGDPRPLPGPIPPPACRLGEPPDCASDTGALRREPPRGEAAACRALAGRPRGAPRALPRARYFPRPPGTRTRPWGGGPCRLGRRSGPGTWPSPPMASPAE